MHDDANTRHSDDHVEALLRSLSPEDLEEVPAPPPSVWDGIEAELADEQVVHHIDTRRRSTTRPGILAAAAAVVAIVVAGVAVVASRGSDNDPGRVLATAELGFDASRFDPLGEGSSATVALVDVDGVLEIDVKSSDLPADLAEDADLEMWMVEPDADGNVVDLVPIGVVNAADPGSFAVPDGYDPTTYAVIDISIEPRDGDVTHSGRSILRGELSDV